MSSVFVMIAKHDLPIFEKGDIITPREDSDDFGSKVKDNPKFKIIEVTGTTLEEAEALVLPLAQYEDNSDLAIQLKPRMLTVDVDALLDKTSVTKEYFMSLLTRKEIITNIQAEDVIV